MRLLRKTSTRARAAAAVLALCGTLVLAPAPAGAHSVGDVAKDAGLGAATALTTVVYAPFKMAFATAGLLVGGIAWAVSGGDHDVAMAIFSPTGRGDYVVTRSHLNGSRQLAFVGPQARAAHNVASGPWD